MCDYWYSACGNSNSPRMWGKHLEHTLRFDRPGTCFEAHGLEVEKHAKNGSLEQLFTDPILENLVRNSSSRILLQCSTEYTRVGEEPYSTVYAWLRSQGVPLDQVIVLTCSDHLAHQARKIWSEPKFVVFDWWEYGPRWWHQNCEPRAKARQRFTSLNRRPHEWRAAITHRLRQVPEYWQNAVHTIGNRNYHAIGDDAAHMIDLVRNHGTGYFNPEIENWAHMWYTHGREIQLPEATSFIDNRLYEAARSGAVNLVIESYPNQSRHSPTEKTYRAYAVARPHVTMGHHNWSENLLARGYHCYPWDAEYNHLRDPNERLYAVVQVIERMALMSEKSFKRLVSSVQPTVDHNHENWLKRTERDYLVRHMPEELKP